jgi:hypothetical protein
MISLEPDVEADAIGYLDPLLTARVSTKVPNPRVADMVQLSVVGGSGVTDKALANALVSVQCWAATSVAASLLARTVAAHLRAWGKYEVRTGTPQSFPDSATSPPLPRYVFTAELWGLASPA